MGKLIMFSGEKEIGSSLLLQNTLLGPSLGGGATGEWGTMSLLQVPRDPRFEEKLRKLVDLAVKRYNRYRAPESVAKVENISGDVVRVRFEGSFCETCGINDWVDDFRYVLEDLGAEAELLQVVEPEDYFYEDWRIGIFRVKKLPADLDRLIREEEELEKYFEEDSE